MADASAPAFFARPDGLRLAYRHRPGGGPTLVFLPGYASDMAGTKAQAIDIWAQAQGQAALLFDYAGCGTSEGRFEDQTLVGWRDDALLLIDALTEGPIILIGSSMGGWLMLLVALARPERIAGLVGIAPAPDFTDWGFSDAVKAILMTEGRIVAPSDHADAPLITTRAFWESGQSNLLLDAPIALDCPVRLLHGQADVDVPWAVSLRLAEVLAGSDIRVTLVKDGDHRLSRDSDIALLLATVAEIA